MSNPSPRLIVFICLEMFLDSWERSSRPAGFPDAQWRPYQGPGATSSVIARTIGRHLLLRCQVREALDALLVEGWVRREGSGRTARWWAVRSADPRRPYPE